MLDPLYRLIDVCDDGVALVLLAFEEAHAAQGSLTVFAPQLLLLLVFQTLAIAIGNLRESEEIEN